MHILYCLLGGLMVATQCLQRSPGRVGVEDGAASGGAQGRVEVWPPIEGPPQKYQLLLYAVYIIYIPNKL